MHTPPLTFLARIRVAMGLAHTLCGQGRLFRSGTVVGICAMLVLLSCGKQPTPVGGPLDKPAERSPSEEELGESPTAAMPPKDMRIATDEERFDQMFDRYEEMRTFIDRSQFDRTALLDRLDHDADKVVDFVTQEVYFEQYPGLLRGAKGTLMAHAGNALDQSVLLATLLKDVGREARIARATLTTAQAEALVKQMAVPRTTAPIGDVDAMLDVRRAMMVEGGADKAALKEFDQARKTPAGRIEDSPIYQAARDDADWLLAQLEAAGVTLAEGMDDRIREEARDYFWVEHRLARGEDWVAVHPCFHDPAAVPADLKVTKLMTAEVPAELQHRLKVRVVIEQKVGDSLKEIEVMPTWERPSANLVGVPLVYTNLPSGMLNAESEEDLKRAMVDSEFYIPVFNNALAPGGQLFNPQGFTLPPEEGASNYGAVFATMGDKLGGSIGAIGTLGTEERPEDYLALSAQWIEYTLVAPGGEETTHRRAVFDRIGPANRAAEEVVMKPLAEGEEDEVGVRLSLHRNFMMDVGGLSAAYGLHELLSNLAENRTALDEALKTGEARGEVKLEDFGELDLRSLVHLGMYPYFAAIPGAHLSYRPAPVVLNYAELIEPGKRTMVEADIVANPRRSFERAGETVQFSAKHNTRAGVWETYVEGQPLERASVLQGLTKEIRDTKTAHTVVTDASAASEVEGATADAITVLKHRLKTGTIAVAPVSVAAPEAFGWWQLDVRTGQVVGVLSSGAGGVEVNEVILRAAQAAALVRSQTDNQASAPKEYVVIAVVLGVGAGIVLGVGCLYIRPGQYSKCFMCGLGTGVCAGSILLAAAGGAISVPGTIMQCGAFLGMCLLENAPSPPVE